MKHIVMTYHMEKGTETAVRWLGLPVSEEIAAGLAAGEDTDAGEYAADLLDDLAHCLALLAGYRRGDYVSWIPQPEEYIIRSYFRYDEDGNGGENHDDTGD